MASGEGRLIVTVISDKNVGPAVSIEIGDNDLTRVNGSGHFTGDYLCGTVDVRASGLTKSDCDGRALHGPAEKSKDHVRNPVTIDVRVAAKNILGATMQNRRQNGLTVECVWNF